MRWRRPERHRSTFLNIALLIFLAAAAVDGSGRAAAQDATSTPTSEPVDDGLVVHEPFTTWDDSDAIPFDSLSAAEQDGVMRQAEISDINSGYDVAQSWSAYSHGMADLAAAETARRLSGLTGTDDIGVTP